MRQWKTFASMERGAFPATQRLGLHLKDHSTAWLQPDRVMGAPGSVVSDVTIVVLKRYLHPTKIFGTSSRSSLLDFGPRLELTRRKR